MPNQYDDIRPTAFSAFLQFLSTNAKNGNQAYDDIYKICEEDLAGYEIPEQDRLVRAINNMYELKELQIKNVDGEKQRALSNQIKYDIESTDLVLVEDNLVKAMSDFHKYKSEQESKAEQEKFKNHPNASSSNNHANKIIKELNEKQKEYEGRKTGLKSLFYWQTKLDKKENVIPNIIKDIEDIGIKDPENYNKKLQDVLNKYIKENEKDHVLSRDTEKKFKDTIENLKKIAAPEAEPKAKKPTNK